MWHIGALISRSLRHAHERLRGLTDRHGLGDSAHADGINRFIDDIKDLYPGIFVHSVSIPTDGNADAERKAGFVCTMKQAARRAI